MLADHTSGMTFEILAARIEALAAERRQLREQGASAEVLEHSRRVLIAAHRELAQALLARHLPDRRAA